jgi:hypothetical protein
VQHSYQSLVSIDRNVASQSLTGHIANIGNFKTKMKTSVTIILLLLALQVNAQYYRYSDNTCLCENAVSNPYFNKEAIEDYFNSKLPPFAVDSLNGSLFLLIYIEKDGKSCCRSIRNTTNTDIRGLKIFELIQQMPNWQPAIYKGKVKKNITPKKGEPLTSRITLQLKFSNCEMHADTVSIDSLDFYPVGYVLDEVEIENKNFRDTISKPKVFCEVFNAENSPMRENYSRAVSIDKQGAIWCGTDNGLIKISNNRMTSYSYLNSILKQDKRPAVGKGKTNGIMCSAVDSSDNKWFSDGHNIYRFDNVRWTSYDTTTLPIRWCTQMSSGKNSTQLATFQGALIYENGEWFSIDSTTDRLPSQIVYTIFIDSKNRKWIGTRNGNVCIQDTSHVFFSKYNTPLNSDPIISATEDWDNNIWFGLSNADNTGGIAVLSENGDWTTFNISNSNIPGNTILDFAVDKERKLIWMSIAGVGIVLFKNEQWYAYTQDNSGVPGTYISDIDLDKNGDLWAATSNGLLHLKLIENQ